MIFIVIGAFMKSLFRVWLHLKSYIASIVTRCFFGRKVLKITRKLAAPLEARRTLFADAAKRILQACKNWINIVSTGVLLKLPRHTLVLLVQ